MKKIRNQQHRRKTKEYTKKKSKCPTSIKGTSFENRQVKFIRSKTKQIKNLSDKINDIK